MHAHGRVNQRKIANDRARSDGYIRAILMHDISYACVKLRDIFYTGRKVLQFFFIPVESSDSIHG